LYSSTLKTTNTVHEQTQPVIVC